MNLGLVCEICRVGRLEEDYVPYLHVNNGQVMIIPNVPALVCDQCQHTQHDPDFMNQIGNLLSGETEPSENTLEQERLLLQRSRAQLMPNRRNS